MSSKARRYRPRDLAVVAALLLVGVTISFLLTYLTVESEDNQAAQAFQETFAEPVSQFQQYFAVRLLGVRAVADALSLFPPEINRNVSLQVSFPHGARHCRMLL